MTNGSRGFASPPRGGVAFVVWGWCPIIFIGRLAVEPESAGEPGPGHHLGVERGRPGKRLLPPETFRQDPAVATVGRGSAQHTHKCGRELLRRLRQQPMAPVLEADA